MKKGSLMFTLLCMVSLGYSQNSINSSGTEYQGAGSVSYSLGQLTTKTIDGTGSLFQGVQIASEYFLVGIEDVLSISSLAIVYPNPTDAYTTIQLPSLEAQVSYILFNSQGVELQTDEIGTMETIVPTNTLTSGVYYLQVLDKNNVSKTFKIIKK